MTEFEKELVRFVSGYLEAGVSAEDYVKAFSQRLLDSIGQQSKPKVSEGVEEEIDKRWKEWISDDKEQVEGVLPKSEFAFYARHFYELGRQSKEQPLCEDFDLESGRFFRKLPLRANTPPIPDEYIDEETFDKIARHFAQWGAEHRGNSETPKDLEEAAKSHRSTANYGGDINLAMEDSYKKGAKWQRNRLLPMIDNICKRCRIQHEKENPTCEDVEDASKAYADYINSNEVLYTYTDFADAFKAGAKWQKGQMMKKAVEGSVFNRHPHFDNDVFVQSDSFPKGQFNPCDRVKMIIIKED